MLFRSLDGSWSGELERGESAEEERVQSWFQSREGCRRCRLRCHRCRRLRRATSNEKSRGEDSLSLGHKTTPIPALFILSFKVPVRLHLGSNRLVQESEEKLVHFLRVRSRQEMGSAFDDFDLQRRSTGQLLRPLAHQRNRVDLRQYQVSALLAKREEEERTISPVPWQIGRAHV